MHAHNLFSKLALIAAAALFLPLAVRAASMDAVHVVTYFEVSPTSGRAGSTLVAQYARATRAESGNTSTTALQELSRSNRFVVIESWSDQAAFAAHEKAAVTAGFRDKYKTISRSPYDQRVNHNFANDPAPTAAGSKAIYVVTHVDVPAARREEAEALLKQLRESSRNDAGLVRYDIFQQNDPRLNHFAVFAVWNSRSAFDAHGGNAQVLKFRETLAPMLGALYDERLFLPIL
jgi:quinol monooxygenase YgiN